MKLNLDKLLTQANDYHLPASGVIFAVGSVLQWYHRLDASYVAFCSTVLGFIGGHAWIKAKNGSDDSDTGAGQPGNPVASQIGGQAPPGPNP